MLKPVVEIALIQSNIILNTGIESFDNLIRNTLMSNEIKNKLKS